MLSVVDMHLTSTHAEEGDRQAFARRDTEGGQEGTDVQGGLALSGLGCASACVSQPVIEVYCARAGEGEPHNNTDRQALRKETETH